MSKWIQENSLLSRNLTIIDALGPASIPHDPAHIDILDKDITGKVFEKILTKAHISGDGQVRLINPNGVDVRGYQEKLDQYVKECEDTLMKYCVHKLPHDIEKSLRIEVGASNGEVLTYGEHFGALKEKLMELRCDDELLEEVERVREEILMAKQYRNQAESLLEEFNKKQQQSKLLDSTQDLRSPSYASSSVSANSTISIKSNNGNRLTEGNRLKQKKVLNSDNYH